MALENGNSSAMDIDRLSIDARFPHSESELSDVVAPSPPSNPSTQPPPHHDVPHNEHHRQQDLATSESDPEEDAAGSEDAEYAAESPPSQHSHQSRSDSQSSGAESQPRKRKVDVDDDHHMLENPELYGLRRSGRARPSRRIVDSSDEEDASASDVNTSRARKRSRPSAAARPTSNRQSTVRQTSFSESESEADTYGGARSRGTAKKQRRRLQGASSRDTPSMSEVRFSTRRAAKVATYNEEDGDDFEEDPSDNLTPSYWATTEDTSPAIDLVLNHRLMEGVDTKTPDKHDYEFFIKWQGQAHYHATWEPWSALTSFRGYRRLENYYRKIVQEEQNLNQDPDIAPEEREKWILDRETYLDALEDYMKVERVIGARDGEEDTEYYVKWRTLPYDGCTWESAALVSELAQGEIDRYLDRSSKLPTSDKRESNINSRRPYKPFRSQPDYIKHGTLRDFQIAGINFLAHNWCKGNNVILADEMGLGKTVQSVSFMSWLKHDRAQEGPFIVVVPLSTMPAWAETFNNWTPDLNYVVYNGNEASRNIIRDYELLVDGNFKKVKFNVMLTTYEYILLDSSFLSQIKWQFMAVDEAHRLKNRESQLYAKLMEFGAPCRLLITGTPLQNELKELSALMNFLMPGLIDIDDDIPIDDSDATREALKKLMDAISPYMIRRIKENVTSDLPPKTEKIIRVELSDVQLEYYKNILTRNYAALNSGNKGGQKQSLLNIMMELKKASNHPFMFPNAEDRILAGGTSREDQLKAIVTSSGKMMLLDQLLTKMKKDGHRVLIFSQMVRMLDIIGDYLQMRGHQYQRLDGTIASGPRRQAIDHFNAPESKDFCFILSTRAGGLGINLMTADTVILFDSDWNPQADLQAMARAHRIGQKNPVSIYRLVSKDTVEEEVLERARNKLILEHITIHQAITEKEVNAIKSRLDAAGVGTNEPVSSDDISRILRRRGQKMFEQSGNQKKLEELDIDAVLENAEVHNTEQGGGITASGGADFLKSFEYTDVKLDLEWDEIIPKDQLEQIKAEEKRKEEMTYLDNAIAESQPRKRKAAMEDSREQRAAKKLARDRAAEAAADAESDGESGTERDPNRELNEKEVRNLIRAHEKFGSIEDRQEELVKDARLVGRNIEVLKKTLGEIISTSERLLQEEVDRVATLERTSNKPVTKKDKKAVLFDFRGVKRLNAETLTERPVEMRMLKEVTEALSDWRNFRVPEASKPANYTCPWGAREDGMLCVGIAKHGYGAWVAIRDDPELGMTDKFFLEEHRVDKKEERTKGDEKNAKSPGAVHLVRRANYLLSVLKDKTSNGTNQAAKRALENHHRNNKKHHNNRGRHDRHDGHGSFSASPAPGTARKLHREDTNRHRSQNRDSVDRRLPTSNGNHKGTSSQANAHRKSTGDRHREDDRKAPRPADPMRKLVAPIKETLTMVKKLTKSHYPDDKTRVGHLRKSLLDAGNFFRSKAAAKEASESQLWNYVAENYWPQGKDASKHTPGEKLMAMYIKFSEKAAATAAAAKTADGPAKTADGLAKAADGAAKAADESTKAANGSTKAANGSTEAAGDSAKAA